MPVVLDYATTTDTGRFSELRGKCSSIANMIRKGLMIGAVDYVQDQITTKCSR